MRNTIGNQVTLTLVGESHNSCVGVVLDGLCAGIPIDEEEIRDYLSLRRPNGKGETSRVEEDTFHIVSGVFQGRTTGSSILILIDNQNTHSSDYKKLKDLPRPSHVDYVAEIKYHGYQDYRGGGHFSGRVTAPIAAAGAILLKALERKNIYIGGHIKQIGNVIDRDFISIKKDIDSTYKKSFPVFDNVEDFMKKEMEEARLENDSIGGKIEIAICNLPVGIGEPFFSSLESELSKAMFSIGGVKGIEFGLGFGFINKKGSQVNDEWMIDDGKIKTKTNYNGGINGGISNGMPVTFSLAIKPTPSIGKEQNTISLTKLTNEKLVIEGRHDPCIVRRVYFVALALTAFVIADLYTLRYGNDALYVEE